MKNLDPTKYNLSSRIQLGQNDVGDIFIKIIRKSRIIMKDGHRILDMVQKIQEVEQDKTVSVITSAPVCSKTRHFLSEYKITIDER